MQRFWRHLSPRQNAWFGAVLAGMAVIIAIGIALEPDQHLPTEGSFNTEMGIRQIAPKLGVTGRALARELGLPLQVPKSKPLAQLGVTAEQLDDAVHHLLSHKPTMLKYYVFVALVFFGLVFMTKLGRSDDKGPRRRSYPRAPYVAALVVAVIVCGFLLGKSPNPMEGAVKFLKSLVGLYPSVAAKAGALAFFIALAIVGNKLICGWACPFGAVQELAYTLPILRRVKKWKLPFWLSNTIRGGLFAVMLLLLFGIIGDDKGFVLYHAINPFNLFDLDFDEWLVPVTVIASIVLGLIVYRPFCYLICPFGFLSWFTERFSLARVRIDRATCTRCGTCADACPSDAADGLVRGKLLPADCMSCARCLNVCPYESIRYEFVFPLKSASCSTDASACERQPPASASDEAI